MLFIEYTYNISSNYNTSRSGFLKLWARAQIWAMGQICLGHGPNILGLNCLISFIIQRL